MFFRHHNVDVSVAVSADSGLITPIVFNADKKVRNKGEYECMGVPMVETLT